MSDPVIIDDDDLNKTSMAVFIGVAAGGGVFALIVIVVTICAIRKYACKKENMNEKE